MAVETANPVMTTQTPTFLVQRYVGIEGYVTVDYGSDLKDVLLLAEAYTARKSVAHRVIVETLIQGFSPA
jgi:hypothetical protein